MQHFFQKGKIKRAEEKGKEHLREGAEEKKREKEKKRNLRRTFFRKLSVALGVHAGQVRSRHSVFGPDISVVEGRAST